MAHCKHDPTQRIREKLDATTLVGNSEKIKEIMEVVKRVSSTRATVLIQGESGTGKELVANIIHYNSPVMDGPFLKVNCCALSEGLLESELFGHEKGDLTQSVQVKLLRVLQESEFERVGGTKTIKVNVRLLTATNKSLEDLIKEEKFREDLYYRLKVVTIDVPSLRERKEDIPALVDYHLKKCVEIHNKQVIGISPEAMKIIKSHHWPGNIRELINSIESAVVLTGKNYIDIESLPPYLLYKQDDRTADGSSGSSLYEIEKKAILEALNKSGGNKTEAAKILGIGLRTLYRKLKEYGL